MMNIDKLTKDGRKGQKFRKILLKKVRRKLPRALVGGTFGVNRRTNHPHPTPPPTRHQLAVA